MDTIPPIAQPASPDALVERLFGNDNDGWGCES